MEEVKKIPGVLGQGKREVMKYFRDYIEDYNTGNHFDDIINLIYN
jgi:hypothetical protein